MAGGQDRVVVAAAADVVVPERGPQGRGSRATAAAVPRTTSTASRGAVDPSGGGRRVLGSQVGQIKCERDRDLVLEHELLF